MKKILPKLKRRLWITLVLTLPDEKRNIMNYSNALYKGLSYVIRQHDQVMVYMSRQLKEYEIRYPTHDLKLAAIVFALRLRKPYLYGEMCISYTDHKSLKYVFKGVKRNTEKAVGVDKRQWLYN